MSAPQVPVVINEPITSLYFYGRTGVGTIRGMMNVPNQGDLADELVIWSNYGVVRTSVAVVDWDPTRNELVVSGTGLLAGVGPAELTIKFSVKATQGGLGTPNPITITYGNPKIKLTVSPASGEVTLIDTGVLSATVPLYVV